MNFEENIINIVSEVYKIIVCLSFLATDLQKNDIKKLLFRLAGLFVKRNVLPNSIDTVYEDDLFEL